jgi:hypothetical protein
VLAYTYLQALHFRIPKNLDFTLSKFAESFHVPVGQFVIFPRMRARNFIRQLHVRLSIRRPQNASGKPENPAIFVKLQLLEAAKNA